MTRAPEALRPSRWPRNGIREPPGTRPGAERHLSSVPALSATNTDPRRVDGNRGRTARDSGRPASFGGRAVPDAETPAGRRPAGVWRTCSRRAGQSKVTARTVVAPTAAPIGSITPALTG